MNPHKFLSRFKMKRGGEKRKENETDTDTAAEEDDVAEEEEEEDVTDSDESAANKRVEFFGIPLYKLSYERLPRKCIKFSFLSINGATLLAGATAVIISIWMLADNKFMSRLVGQRLFVTILLFVGIYWSVVSTLGLLAFVKRKRRFLLIYIVCHSVSLCLIFASSIMSFTLFERISKKLSDDMVNSIGNYRSLDWVTESWDNTHAYLKCCGIKSFKDWQEYRFSIPHSCCSASIDKCLNMSEDVAYKTGCLRSAVFFLKSHIQAVALAALFVSVTLVASLFFALGVCKRFKTNRTGKA